MSNGRHVAPLLFGGLGCGGFAAGLLLAWALAPIAAHAQAAQPADGPIAASPDRTRSLVVYGDDPCPTSTGNEIVVCSRRPENERYRLPKRFRGRRAAESPASNAWANKNATVEQASRTAAGLPDTCSAVGSGGQTGCFRQFQTQMRAQRRADQDEKAAMP